jgi:hypothetical protein
MYQKSLGVAVMIYLEIKPNITGYPSDTAGFSAKYSYSICWEAKIKKFHMETSK